MFKTVCSNCGKDCEVPFRPTSGKPVYCSDCFEKMGGRNSDGPRPERPERNRSDFGPRPQAPRVDNTKVFEDLNKKLETMSVKLEKIIELLTPQVEVVVEKPAKVVKAKKAKAVKEVEVTAEV
jgi:CxxC-x17-CxxC domain-containing protein